MERITTSWRQYKKSNKYWRKVYKNRRSRRNVTTSTQSVSVAAATRSRDHSNSSPNSSHSSRSNSPASVRSSQEMIIDDNTDKDIVSADDDDYYLSPEENDGEGSESADENEVVPNEDFSMFLRRWATGFGIRHQALKILIRKLNTDHDFRLPTDPRTILGRNSSVSSHLTEIGGGFYWHQGIEHCLRQCFARLQRPQKISININIDGLPIHNNGKGQFWPILFNIHEFPDIKPMSIGMFYGNSKPHKIEEFLQPFVDEIQPILHEGLVINGHKLEVNMRAFICDSPARSFIKGTFIIDHHSFIIDYRFDFSKLIFGCNDFCVNFRCAKFQRSTWLPQMLYRRCTLNIC